ncbi:calpain-14 [Trachypithecus francoisi]|uniref:calpain-14 n=1 Tax=Trachypithecus francoisi TaxID=54180 RepID=UPI00141B92AB|nr:calpain-14 [Trachypithecus francoisi]XP_033032021.1 calpain-14 [Trachypithecus francoisi]
MSLWPPFPCRWKLGPRYSRRASPQLPQQDFEALLAECLRNGCLFEDTSFPATLRSIGSGSLLQKLPPRLQWKRPPELHSNPQFYSAKTKRLDLCQGMVGDCWFLAALQALTLHQDILSRVVPLNQSFTEKYAGIFRFWFWHYGNWVPVVIDDRLPVNESGQLLFVSSTYKNLFWGALLEKAYAKLSGSYEDLQSGQVSEALVDFTGGVTMTINLAAAHGDLWDILTKATYNRTLIGCQTHSGKEKILENGLVEGHAYTVTGIRKVTCKHRPEYLVKLRNPWGQVEWKGDWSDSSSKWELLSPKEKILLLRKDNDGEFWMTLQDFKTHFVLLVICKLTPGLLSQEAAQKWMYTMWEGRWEKGSTAGGQRQLLQGTFWKNPQFLLSVWRPEEGRRSLRPCSVLVSLLQKPRHRCRKRKPHLAIGFYLYRVNKYHDDQRKLPPEFFQRNTPLSQPDRFLKEKEVSQELCLEPGTYLIVPCASEANQKSEFILRVFSRKHIFYEIGSNSGVIFSKEIEDQNEGQNEFFTKFFEKHPEINAVQLQNILNQMTWSRLGSRQPFFSLEACQGILALLDFNASGTMSIQEFRDLWKQLKLYQKVFHKQDNGSGYLNWEQLRAAMREAGTMLSDDVCQLMLIRYGCPRLQMGFVSFVHLMLRVENMEDVFQNLTQDGKGIYLQKPEWMMMALYS